MNAQSQAVVTQERPGTLSYAVEQFTSQINKRAGHLLELMPKGRFDPAKFQASLVTAVKSNPQLLRCDRVSLIMACEKAAQDGLIPDGREAALVPFKSSKQVNGKWEETWTVQYMPMVYGLRKKILQSGEVTDIKATVVYRKEVEAGTFYYEEGTQSTLRHVPMMIDVTADDVTDDKIVAAYSIATYTDGSKSYEVMRRFEVDKVRECSQTGATKDRYGKPRTPKGPWVDWFPEQAKKTVIRRHSKTLPMSSDVFVDVEGTELESARTSVELLESVKPDAPVVLPDKAEPPVAPHDPVTGELLEDQSQSTSGVQMTGLDDEELARQLDAQSGWGDQSQDDNDDQLAQQQTADEPPVWQAVVDKALAGIKAAKNPTYLAGVMAEFGKHEEALPDDEIIKVRRAEASRAASFSHK